MSLPAVFVLGILVGWVIEWVIDWIYWRRKQEPPASQTRELRGAAVPAAMPVADRTPEIEALQAENARLRSELERLAQAPDDLKVIKGIGPEIERRLHEAGIVSYAQLASLTPADLERILGSMIKRLANEQDLLDQARELAHHRA